MLESEWMHIPNILHGFLKSEFEKSLFRQCLAKNGYIKVYLKDVTRYTVYIPVYTQNTYCQHLLHFESGCVGLATPTVLSRTLLACFARCDLPLECHRKFAANLRKFAALAARAALAPAGGGGAGARGPRTRTPAGGVAPTGSSVPAGSVPPYKT
jgi:hypothetical protein